MPQPNDPAMNDDPKNQAWKNRRTLAERLGWPAGALEACEEVEQEHPEWHISYSSGGGRTWSRAGFYAKRKAAWRPEPAPYGANTDELVAAIQAWQAPPTYGIRLIRTDGMDLTENQSFPTLSGIEEISELIGCSREAAEEVARLDSFPAPVLTLAQGSVWLASDIENWIKTRRQDPTTR